MSAATIVIGLGNPGLRYRDTRHNVGFRVVERLADRAAATFAIVEGVGRSAWVAESGGDSPLVLAKPRTYMNRSGRAALALARHFDATPEQLLLVYDDADLELGRIRVRPGGSAGGHNGVRSILDALGGATFSRVKLGVRGDGRGDYDLADYVLERFDDDEEPRVQEMVDRAADAVQAVRREGISTAMNVFNRRSAAETSEEDSDQE